MNVVTGKLSRPSLLGRDHPANAADAEDEAPATCGADSSPCHGIKPCIRDAGQPASHADVCAQHRLPVAGGAEGPARTQHAARLSGLWQWDSTLTRIHHALYVAGRDRAGRQPSPTAAIIDRQSVKSAKKGAGSTRTASVPARRSREEAPPAETDAAYNSTRGRQDRDGGGLLIATLFCLHSFLTKLYADADYQGWRSANAVAEAMEHLEVEIVKRSDLHRFVVLPKRWLVERTIAWLN